MTTYATHRRTFLRNGRLARHSAVARGSGCHNDDGLADDELALGHIPCEPPPSLSTTLLAVADGVRFHHFDKMAAETPRQDPTILWPTKRCKRRQGLARVFAHDPRALLRRTARAQCNETPKQIAGGARHKDTDSLPIPVCGATGGRHMFGPILFRRPPLRRKTCVSIVCMLRSFWRLRGTTRATREPSGQPPQRLLWSVREKADNEPPRARNEDPKWTAPQPKLDKLCLRCGQLLPAHATRAVCARLSSMLPSSDLRAPS